MEYRIERGEERRGSVESGSGETEKRETRGAGFLGGVSGARRGV